MCTFHFLSHVGYSLFHHIPKCGRDSFYYWCLMQSDAASHLIASVAFYTIKIDFIPPTHLVQHDQFDLNSTSVNIIHDYNCYLGGMFMFYFVWHHIKLWDKTMTLRRMTFVTLIEMTLYLIGACLMCSFYPTTIVMSVITYCVFRYFDIIW